MNNLNFQNRFRICENRDIDNGICLNRAERTERWSDEIMSDIIKGFKKNNHQIILDRKEAIHNILNKMHEKSILLILGKGREDYQETKFGKISHSDKKIVENYTYES